MKTLIFILVLCMGWTSFAAEERAAKSDSPLTFTRWKEQQVNEAQNQVVRTSNALLLMKSEKYRPTKTFIEVAEASKSDEFATDEQEQESIVKMEKQLAKYIEQFEFTKDLTINDYFSVYLSQFKDNPEELKKVAKTLTEPELAELLRQFLHLKQHSIEETPERAEPALVSGVPSVPPSKL